MSVGDICVSRSERTLRMLRRISIGADTAVHRNCTVAAANVDIIIMMVWVYVNIDVVPVAKDRIWRPAIVVGRIVIPIPA